MATWYSNGAVNGNSNHNWNATNAWNQATDGTGTAGNPTDGDIAIIQSGDIVTLTADVTSIAAFKVIGTLAGGSGYKITTRGAYSNKPVDNDGTITGIVNIRIENQGTGSSPANGWMLDLLGATSGDKFTNLEVDLTSGTASNNTVEWIGDFNLEGNITIENGTFQGYNGSYTGRCDGVLEIQSGGVFGRSDGIQTAVYQFGEVDIKSGGALYATSTTTTITGVTDADWVWQNAGTFDHNKGKVLFSTSSTSMEMWLGNGDTFYDVEIDSSDPGGVYFHNTVIYGDLIVKDGPFHAYTHTTTLTVHGNTYIKSEGQLINGAAQSGTVTFHGLITNEGILHTGSGTNNFNGGVRNLATMASDDTITIGGTGAILEGDLDDAIINVNLDPALKFDGTNDYISCGTDSDYDITADLCVAVWAKNDNASTTGNEHIISKYAGTDGQRIWRLTIDGTSVKWSCSGDNGTSAETYNLTYTHTGIDEWNHYAGVFDQGHMYLYINGKQVAYHDHTAEPALELNNSVPVQIGSYESGSGLWEGQIADVRIYNDHLLTGGAGTSTSTSTHIEFLASKINTDKTLGAGTTNLKGYWKLNAETASGGGAGTGYVVDESGNGQQGVLTNFPTSPAYWDYGAFSVNVQDTMTTDGTFTVTKGKLEGLSLSSLEFNGTNDQLALNGNLSMAGDFTFSTWFNADEFDNNVLIGKASDASCVIRITNSGAITFNFNNQGEEAISGITFAGTGAWTHLAITRDYSTGKTDVYVNGVYQSTATFDSGNATGNFDAIGRASSYWWDGHLRDMRMYDAIILSAEQIASLYSNTFPVTPKYWWKMDEGTGLVIDQGTAAGTASDSATNNADWDNGTLDLDGGGGDTLVITANGTVSAPRGLLQIHDDISQQGSFIHNNGTLEFTDQSSMRADDLWTGSNAIYNLKITNGSSYVSQDSCNLDIEGDVTGSGGLSIYHNATVTLGTDSRACAYDAGLLRIWTAYSSSTLQSASELYPAVINASTDFLWSSPDSSRTITFKWIDCRRHLDSGTGDQLINNLNLAIGGKCTFVDLEVATGATLVVGAEELEYSGLLSGGGTVTISTGQIVGTGNDFRPDATTITDNAFIQAGDQLGSTYTISASKYPVLKGKRLYSSISSSDFRNSSIIINGTETNYINGDNHNNILVNNASGIETQMGGARTIKGNLYVGGIGTFDTQSQTLDIEGDIRQMKGSTLEFGNSTVRCTGSANFIGGFIGKSLLTFDGSDYVEVDDDNSLDFTTAMTLEGWVKTTGTGNYQHIVCKSGGYYFLSVYNAGGGADGKAMIRVYEGANIDAIGTTKVNDGRWHHIAGTYDTSAGKLKLYVDGRLEATTDNSDAINTSTTKLYIGSNDASTNLLTGELARVSVWNTALTAVQIRKMMFEDFATATTTNCQGWWQMDERYGTNLDDETTNGNDGTLNDAAMWNSPEGTFDDGGSTFTMKGNNTYLWYFPSQTFYNLGLAPGSKTTNISGRSNNNAIKVANILTLGGGTLTQTPQTVELHLDSTGTPITQDATTSLAQIYRTLFNGAGATITAGTYDYIYPNAANQKLGGNVTGSNCLISNNASLDLNSKQISLSGKMELNDNSTLTIDGGAELALTGGSSQLDSNATSILSAGPGATITGVSTKSTFVSQANFEVVGDVANLKVTNEELVVAGTVTNCTGDIIQWHHSQDYDQRLDTDTADDRDLKLGGPALDNANALNT